eukprot:m.408839 g.408839  ORF g.408839 m.408839 type:complete len:2677 (+) comp16800_c0_seq34:376-8406(+)
MAQHTPAPDLLVVPGHTDPRLWKFILKTKNDEDVGPFKFFRWQGNCPTFADESGSHVVEHNGKNWVHKQCDRDKHVCMTTQPPSRKASYNVWYPPPVHDLWHVPSDSAETVSVEVNINYVPVASPEEPQTVPRHLHVVVDADVWNFACEFRSAIGVLEKVFMGCPITYSISSNSPIPQGVHHRVLPCLLWIRSGDVVGSANLDFQPQIKFTDIAVVCHADARMAATNLCTQGNAQCAIAVEPRLLGQAACPVQSNQIIGPLTALCQLFSDIFQKPKDFVHPGILHEYFSNCHRHGELFLRQSKLHAIATIATQFQGVSEGDSLNATVMLVQQAERASLKTTDILAAGSFCANLLTGHDNVPFVDHVPECYKRMTSSMAQALVETVANGVGNEKVFVIPVLTDSRGISENCAKAMAYAVCAHAMCNVAVGVVTYCEISATDDVRVDDMDKIGNSVKGDVLWLNGRKNSVLATAEEVSAALNHVSSRVWPGPNTVIVTAMSTTDLEKYKKMDKSGLVIPTDFFSDASQNDPTVRPVEDPQLPQDGPGASAPLPFHPPRPHRRPDVVSRRVHCARDLRPCLDSNPKESEAPARLDDIPVGATVVINTHRNALSELAAFNLAHSGLDLRPDPSMPERFIIAQTGESALGLHRLHETIAQTCPMVSIQTAEPIVVPARNGSIVVPIREIAALQKLNIVKSKMIHSNLSVVTGKPGLGEQEYIAATDTENHSDKGTFFVCRTTWASQIFFKETDTETGSPHWFFSGYMGGFYKLLMTPTTNDSLLPPECGKWVECDKPSEQQSEIDLPIRHVIRVVPSRQGADDVNSNPHLLLVTDLDLDRNVLHRSISLKFSGMGAIIETAKSLIGRVPKKGALPCLAVIKNGSSSGLGHLWDAEQEFFNVDVVILCVPEILLEEACAQANFMCREGWVGCAIVLESAPRSDALCLAEDVLSFVHQVFLLAKEIDDKAALLVGRIAAHVDGFVGTDLLSVQFFVPGDRLQPLYTVPYDILRPFRSSTLKNVVVTPRPTREHYPLHELKGDQSTRHNHRLLAALTSQRWRHPAERLGKREQRSEVMEPTTEPMETRVVLDSEAEAPTEGVAFTVTTADVDEYIRNGELNHYPCYKCEDSGSVIYRDTAENGRDFWFCSGYEEPPEKAHACEVDPRFDRPPPWACWFNVWEGPEPEEEVLFDVQWPSQPPKPLAPQGDCHLYVAIDTSPDRFARDIHSATKAMQGPRSPFSDAAISVVTGPAFGINVSRRERVPVLLWCATGPNVLPPQPNPDEGDDAPPSNQFIDELGADVDIAVVCMAFGAEWAATRLVQTGVARCAVWIALSSEITQVGRLAGLTQASKLIAELFKRSKNLPICVSDLHTLVVKAEAQVILQNGTVVPTMDGKVSDSTILGSLHLLPTQQPSFSYDPKGSFCHAPTEGWWTELPCVDMLHLPVVHAIRDAILSRLGSCRKEGEAPSPRFLFVVQAWASDSPSPAPANSLRGLLHAVMGSAVSLPPRQQAHVDSAYVCDLNEHTEAVLKNVHPGETGVIWLRGASVTSLEKFFKTEWREHLQGNVVVCDVSSPDDVQPLLKALRRRGWDCHGQNDCFVVHDAPSGQDANFCRFNLLRIEKSAHLSPHKIAGVFDLLVPGMQSRWIDSLYIDGEDIVAGVVVQDLKALHRLREFVVIRHHELVKALQTEFPEDFPEDSTPVNTTLFARHYADIVQSFNRLLPHQKKIYAEWKDQKVVHIVGPAGSGKTFLAVHRAVHVLIEGSESWLSTRKILIVARNLAVLRMCGRWIRHRLQEHTVQFGHVWKSFFDQTDDLASVWGLCEDFNGPQKLVLSDDEATLTFQATTPPTLYDFVVIDEAHHVFNTENMTVSTPFSQCVKKIMASKPTLALCSDESQYKSASTVSMPHTDVTLKLNPVVRNSRHVFQGSEKFMIDSREIFAFSDVNGPPLFSYIFPPVQDSAESKSAPELFVTYARKVNQAIVDLQRDFPNIPLGNNLAILVSDDHWRSMLISQLDFDGFFAKFNIVSAADFEVKVAGDKSTIIVDTVDNYAGLESLVVISVGLDTNSDDSQEREVAFNRVYRSLTRAHLFAVVVQEYQPRGCLAWLAIPTGPLPAVTPLPSVDPYGVPTRTLSKPDDHTLHSDDARQANESAVAPDPAEASALLETTDYDTAVEGVKEESTPNQHRQAYLDDSRSREFPMTPFQNTVWVSRVDSVHDLEPPRFYPYDGTALPIVTPPPPSTPRILAWTDGIGPVCADRLDGGVPVWRASGPPIIFYAIDPSVLADLQPQLADLLKCAGEIWSGVADVRFAMATENNPPHFVVKMDPGEAAFARAFLPKNYKEAGGSPRELVLFAKFFAIAVEDARDRQIDVLTKQFGHILGLAHSGESKQTNPARRFWVPGSYIPDPDSVMHVGVATRDRKPGPTALSQEDEMIVRALYGAATKSDSDGTRAKIMEVAGPGPDVCVWRGSVRTVIFYAIDRSSVPADLQPRLADLMKCATEVWSGVADIHFAIATDNHPPHFVVKVGGHSSDVFATSFFPREYEETEKSPRELRVFPLWFGMAARDGQIHILVHELGHALGLRHSNQVMRGRREAVATLLYVSPASIVHRSSVMDDCFLKYVAIREPTSLSREDVLGVCMLYGAATMSACSGSRAKVMKTKEITPFIVDGKGVPFRIWKKEQN